MDACSLIEMQVVFKVYGIRTKIQHRKGTGNNFTIWTLRKLLLLGCEGESASWLVAGIGNDNCIQNFGRNTEEKIPLGILNYSRRINRLDITGSEQEQVVGTLGSQTNHWLPFRKPDNSSPHPQQLTTGMHLRNLTLYRRSADCSI